VCCGWRTPPTAHSKDLSGLIIQKTNREKFGLFRTSKIALFNIMDYISKYRVSLLYLPRVPQLSEKCADGYSDESLELGETERPPPVREVSAIITIIYNLPNYNYLYIYI
jgi:hypothetical protein